MKKNLLAVALLVVVIAVLLIRHLVAYPEPWNHVKKGMTRQQVYELVGPAPWDLGEIKGAWWIENNSIVRNEMNVFFEEETVKWVSVQQKIGTSEHFRTRFIRSDP